MTVKFNPYTRIIQSGSNMVFYDQSNPAGWTLTQLAQSGSGGATSGSIGANLYGSYLLLAPDAQDVNARVLVAGSNITFTDTGPGGTLTIASTASGSGGGSTTVVTGTAQPLQVLTASLASNVTLAQIPTFKTLAVVTASFTDVAIWTKTAGVAAGGNTVHTKIQVDGVDQGQFGMYEETVTNGAGFGTSLSGRVTGLAAGTHTFALLAACGAGSSLASINPLSDTQQGATIMVMNLTASSAVINQVISASGAGWVTAADIPFDAQTSQTFTGNSTVTIANFLFTQLNPGSASLASVIPGTGVSFTNGAATDINGATFTAPVLAIQFQKLFSSYSLPDHDVRIWWWINQDTVSNNFDGAVYGVMLGGTASGTLGFAPTTENITLKKGFFNALGYNPQLNINGTNYVNGNLSGFENYNVQMLQYNRNGRQFAWYIGSGSIVAGNDIWPSINQMQLLAAGDANPNNSFLSPLPITGSGNPSIFFGLQSTGNRAIVESYRRLRFDYLTPTNVAVGQGIATLTGSYVFPDQNDYLWWPCTETVGPTVFNYGTAGAIGNLTASSGNVHFNQVGPLRNAIGPNTAGQTNNWVGTVNTATQPTPNTSSITVSAWFRPENITTTNHQKIVVKSFYNTTATWNSPFSTIDIGLAGTGDGKMEFSLQGLNPSTPTTVSSASCATANAWNHAGMSYDGATVRCYLNGVLIYQFASTGSIDYSGNGWWAIGGNQAIPSTEYFQGQIADVRVANVVRSGSWFAQVWESGRPDATAIVSLILSGVMQISGSGTSNITSGSLSGPNAWVEGGISPWGPSQIRTTSSVAISDGTENVYAGMKGKDIFFYVSGTVGAQEPVANASPAKGVFGGDVVMSGSLNVKGAAGITGSITQMPTGNPYIIGLGGTQILTNSLGQIVVSSSIGGGGSGISGINVENAGAVLPNSPYQTINFQGTGVQTFDVGGVATINIPGVVPGNVPGSFAAYYGYCTGSLLFSGSGSWHNVSEVFGNFTEGPSVNILRNGSTFTVLQTGLYNFQSYFNAIGGTGAGTYIAFRLSGSNGTVLQRTTFATNNQQPAILEGLLQANSGSVFTLQYLVSGSTEQTWTTSDPIGVGIDTQNMRTGHVQWFLIPSGSATVNQYSITASAGNTAFSPANYAMATSSNSFPFDTGTPGYQLVPNTQLTITTTGAPVLIMANANYNAQTNGAQAYFSLNRDGVNLAPGGGLQGAGPLNQSFNANASFAYVDFGAGPGTHTYQLMAEAVVGAGELGAWGVGPTALMAFEMKGANVVTASTTQSQAVPGGNLIGLSASINPRKNPVLVIASSNTSSDAGGNWCWTDVFRNGTSLANGATAGMSVNVGSNTNELMGCCWMVLDQGATVGATNTYIMRATNGAGTNHVNFGNQLSSLILWELTDVNFKYSFTTTQTTPAAAPTYTDVDVQNPTAGLITRGRPVLLIATINSNTSTTTGRTNYTFFRNGGNVTTGSKGLQLVDGEGSTDWNRMPTLFWIDQNPVNNQGFYQYQVMGSNTSGSSFVGQGSYTYLFMYELDPGGTGVVIDGWLDEGNFLFTTSSIQALGNASFGNTTVTQLNQIGSNVNNIFSGSVTILGTLTFQSGSGMAITGSSVSRQFTIPFLSAMVTTPQFSGSKANLGVHKYDGSKFNTNIDPLTYKYRAIFAPVFGNGNAYVDLYDYSGIINGTPGPVSGSVLTASLPSTLTLQEADISNVLSTVTGSGIFLARAWVDPSGSNFVNVGGVELSLEWR